MKCNKIIGIVFVYKPNIHELVTNISKYIDYIDVLIIWQNSELMISDRILLKAINEGKIRLLGDGCNVGLAVPVNTVIAQYGDKFDYLLTMDQDSTWWNFKGYLAKINEKAETFIDNNIWIFGPQISTNTNHLVEKNEIQLVDHVITSGAIYYMQLFKVIGGLREDYFIDALDEEICWRAYNYGYKTACVTAGILYQKFGETIKKKLFFRQIYYMKHNVDRTFYIVRNHIYLIREYKFPIRVKINILNKYVFSAIIKIIFFDKERFPKIKAIVLGFFSGIKKNKNIKKISYPLKVSDATIEKAVDS